MGTKAKALIDKAKQFYPDQEPEGKILLCHIFGKETFGPVNIMDDLKTWEDACRIFRNAEATALPYPNPVSERQEAVNGIHQMFIIRELLNEGWVSDYNDTSQAKWRPYFKADPSGFGLAFRSTDSWDTFTTVGARLDFETSEKAEYAGRQFINIYNKFLTISNKS